MNYNHEQRKAIHHADGPMLVCAGPGSGKTAVIAARVHYLIEDCSVPPERILTVTFTKSAANEMSQRFEGSSAQSASPLFATFHSFFFRILRETTPALNIKVISETRKSALLRAEALRFHNVLPEIDAAVPILSAEISRFKNQPETEDSEINSFTSAVLSPPLFREFVSSYERALSAEHLIDCDDILRKARELLNHRPDVREHWQKHFSHIQIDEFQDINGLQYDIMLLLAPHGNLFVVGDDDQSIYGFRGACPDAFSRFLADFPNAQVVHLSTNYRCPKPIVDCAGQLIRHNHRRIFKDIHSHKDDSSPVVLHSYPDQKAQYKAIADHIGQIHRSGLAFSDIAVLLRSHRELPWILECFRSYNLPVCTFHKQKNGMPHFLILDMQSYLRIAIGCASKDDFARVLNRPERFLSRNAFAGQSCDGFSALELYYQDVPQAQEQIRTWHTQMDFIRTLHPEAALNYLLNVTGYRTFLTAQKDSSHKDPSSYTPMLRILQRIARQSHSLPEFLSACSRDDVFDKEDRLVTKDGIHVMTMHAAKGLEFHTVFLPDLNKGNLPSGQSLNNPSQIEEERRLFYVAMTRASARLYLSYTETVHGKPVAPSPFLSEMECGS